MAQNDLLEGTGLTDTLISVWAWAGTLDGNWAFLAGIGFAILSLRLAFKWAWSVFLLAAGVGLFGGMTTLSKWLPIGNQEEILPAIQGILSSDPEPASGEEEEEPPPAFKRRRIPKGK